MKEMFIHILLPVILMLSINSTAQEARLSYNLKEGEKYLLDIDLQQNTHSESLNNQEITLSNRMKLEFLVDSIKETGLIYMSARYRDLHLTMLAPALSIDIDSRTGNNRMLTEMVASLEKDSFNVIMNSSGELISVDGIIPMFQALEAIPVADTNQHEVILSTLNEAYGTGSFNSMFSLFVSVYPVVQQMTKWTRDITYYFNTKPVKMVNRYYFTRTTGEDVIIQGLGMLNSIKNYYEKTDMGEVESSVSGSQTYDFLMEPETGWLNRCVSRQRAVIETTIIRSSFLPKGLKIPSYTETIFEVKGSVLK